jgi:hypothetical protein
LGIAILLEKISEGILPRIARLGFALYQAPYPGAACRSSRQMDFTLGNQKASSSGSSSIPVKSP